MNTAPLTIDFTQGKTHYRRQQPDRHNQLLVRAIGKRTTHTVIDATAGLGEDSFVLAYLGYSVTLLERVPTVYTLLKDALQNIATDPAAANMHLIHDDAIHYLTQLKPTHCPDIIYLDPMYPPRKKTALNKQPLRHLRTLVGDDHDAPELLAIALQRAKKTRCC